MRFLCQRRNSRRPFDAMACGFIERCTNKYIKRIVASYDSNLRRYQSMSVDALNDVRVSAQQHLDILKTLRTRDPEKASEALKAHLEWSTDLLRITF